MSPKNISLSLYLVFNLTAVRKMLVNPNRIFMFCEVISQILSVTKRLKLNIRKRKSII